MGTRWNTSLPNARVSFFTFSYHVEHGRHFGIEHQKAVLKTPQSKRFATFHDSRMYERSCQPSKVEDDEDEGDFVGCPEGDFSHTARHVAAAF
jgi:hypothetical protein